MYKGLASSNLQPFMVADSGLAPFWDSKERLLQVFMHNDSGLGRTMESPGPYLAHRD